MGETTGHLEVDTPQAIVPSLFTCDQSCCCSQCSLFLCVLLGTVLCVYLCSLHYSNIFYMRTPVLWHCGSIYVYFKRTIALSSMFV